MTKLEKTDIYILVYMILTAIAKILGIDKEVLKDSKFIAGDVL